mmetsp:Transcript_154988/g.496762  ORF Transcript_154988/g.496762 Transcript_154988/m.496762 type:complete len:377 (+) Transcript_154988:1386-2516(+)
MLVPFKSPCVMGGFCSCRHQSAELMPCKRCCLVSTGTRPRPRAAFLTKASSATPSTHSSTGVTMPRSCSTQSPCSATMHGCRMSIRSFISCNNAADAAGVVTFRRPLGTRTAARAPSRRASTTKPNSPTLRTLSGSNMSLSGVIKRCRCFAATSIPRSKASGRSSRGCKAPVLSSSQTLSQNLSKGCLRLPCCVTTERPRSREVMPSGAVRSVNINSSSPVICHSLNLAHTSMMEGRIRARMVRQRSAKVWHSSWSGTISASRGHCSGVIVRCLTSCKTSSAVLSVRGLRPTTTMKAKRPKEKTSALGAGGPPDRPRITSGAIHATVPPKGFAFLVRSRESPKSSNLARGPDSHSSTKMLEPLRSPCTMTGFCACK